VKRKLLIILLSLFLVTTFSFVLKSWAEENYDPELGKILLGKWEYKGGTIEIKEFTQVGGTVSGVLTHKKYGQGNFKGSFVREGKNKIRASIVFPDNPKLKNERCTMSLGFKGSKEDWKMRGNVYWGTSSFSILKGHKI
jgi:hypothetical protein